VRSDPRNMTNLRKRTTAIQELAERFAAEAPTLIDALVSDFHFARGAAPRHVQEALAYLMAWPADDAAAVNEAVRSGQRKGSGAVAILLHEDAPLTSFARTLPAAFLAGAQQCVVNVPPTAEATRALLDKICSSLPGVVVQNDRAGAFLFRSLTDAYTRTIWAGGAADLMAPLEDLIQDTRSHVVFEGPGNDAIVVGSDADIDAAAHATAKLAFRDGGLDPASPNRVYVPEDLHDAFSDKLCEYAAAYEIADYNDASCSISPMRSEEAREHINDVLDEAEDEDAELAVGLDFRNFEGQEQPTLYATVVTGCNPGLRIVTERCHGPVLSVVPYEDDVALFSGLDQSAGPDGQVGAGVTLIGGEDLREELGRRFTYVFGEEGPYASDAREARLAWGGGPTSWTFMGGPDGMKRRYGSVDLTYAFSRDALTSRARWRRRTEEAAAAK